MLATLEGLVKCTLVSASQTANAKGLTVVTPEGMVTLVSRRQTANAEKPMFVTLEGMVMLVSP